MTAKKTDRQKLAEARKQLIASRRECAELRRKLEEVEQAALTAIAAFTKQDGELPF